MKTILLSALALVATASVAMAEPVKPTDEQPAAVRSGPVQLTDAEMDTIAAGAITPVQVNGGGNTPNGNANGVPTVNQNPTGFAPPGQN